MTNTTENIVAELYRDYKMANKMSVPAQCHSNMEYKDVLVFSTNLAMAAARSGIILFFENVRYLLLIATLILLLFILYKSYLSPPIYVKVSLLFY